MIRFTIRDVLWLTVLVAMGAGWWYHAWGLWIGKAFAEQEMQLLKEALAECRQELLEPKPQTARPTDNRP